MLSIFACKVTQIQLILLINSSFQLWMYLDMHKDGHYLESEESLTSDLIVHYVSICVYLCSF